MSEGTEKTRLSTSQLIISVRNDAEGFDLLQRGRMSLTLPWKGRCAVYQLTVAVATQMSHKLVYGADELYFFKGASLGFMVLDFRERSEV